MSSTQSSEESEKRFKGVKHLVQCHCMLPHYKSSPEPVFHQFVVFSIVNLASDTVVPKFSECNNCGAVHKIVDFCKSEIVTGREDLKSQLSLRDLKHSLPESLFELLESYNKTLPDFEHAQFILENQLWEDFIVLTREEIEDYVQGKLVRFITHDRFRVESYTTRSSV